MSQLKVNSIVPVGGAPSGGGGGITQVLTNTTRDAQGSVSLTSDGTLYDIPNINVTITPSSSSNKIQIFFHIMAENSNDDASVFYVVKRAISGGGTTLLRGTSTNNRTAILTQGTLVHYSSDTDSTPAFAQCAGFLDSPNTSSAITYTVQVGNNEQNSTWYYNRTGNTANAATREVGLSWITVMEVSA